MLVSRRRFHKQRGSDEDARPVLRVQPSYTLPLDLVLVLALYSQHVGPPTAASCVGP